MKVSPNGKEEVSSKKQTNKQELFSWRKKQAKNSWFVQNS